MVDGINGTEKLIDTLGLFSKERLQGKGQRVVPGEVPMFNRSFVAAGNAVASSRRKNSS